MKKMIALCIAMSILASCGSNSEPATTATVDSTKVAVDSSACCPAVDTAKTVDTAKVVKVK